LRQPIPEHGDQALGFQIVLGEIHEHADAPYLGRLLRTRSEWIERRRAADNGDEFPPLHALQGHGCEHSTSRLDGLRCWQGSKNEDCDQLDCATHANRITGCGKEWLRSKQQRP
jgi:hypothetical protein